MNWRDSEAKTWTSHPYYNESLPTTLLIYFIIYTVYEPYMSRVPVQVQDTSTFECGKTHGSNFLLGFYPNIHLNLTLLFNVVWYVKNWC